MKIQPNSHFITGQYDKTITWNTDKYPHCLQSMARCVQTVKHDELSDSLHIQTLHNCYITSETELSGV